MSDDGPAQDGAEDRVNRQADPARHWRADPLTLFAMLGVSLALILGGLGTWLGYRVHQEDRIDRLRVIFLEAARQGAVSLTTLDHKQADSDVQRILDASTGEFRDDFAGRAQAFAEAVRRAQTTSSGTVTEAGLESMTADGGQVLLAVTVSTASRGVQSEPRYWRMRLSMNRVGEGAKMSRVDFVR